MEYFLVVEKNKIFNTFNKCLNVWVLYMSHTAWLGMYNNFEIMQAESQ
jgi:hypothetical protein